MVKIISRNFHIDPQSFQPELEVTVRIPMEATMDNMALDNQFYEKWARDFFSSLELFTQGNK